MLPLIPLITAALAVFAITEIIRFVMLHWQEIVNWFQNWINGHQSVDKDAVGFTVATAIEKNDFKLVQGVFNKSTGKVEDAREIQAENLDAETRRQCLEKKVTIFS
ncbi:MAG: hypothetical protein IJT50_10535 [Lentisphaeria bacterium]|nr:hypothetical protein [Lentisphaeria bacterium]